MQLASTAMQTFEESMPTTSIRLSIHHVVRETSNALQTLKTGERSKQYHLAAYLSYSSLFASLRKWLLIEKMAKYVAA